MAKTANQSPALERLVGQLARLPGIGNRSAQRIAFYLLKQPGDDVLALSKAIADFKTNLKVCSICANVTEADPCPICADPGRNQGLVLVVEQPADVVSFETLGSYRGVYHVLMGRLAPLEGVEPADLNVHGLIERARQPSPAIREVILGTSPTLEGDGTALYLAQTLAAAGVKVSRLARGLPAGSSLEMASKAVLSDAIEGRQVMD